MYLQVLDFRTMTKLADEADAREAERLAVFVQPAIDDGADSSGGKPFLQNHTDKHGKVSQLVVASGPVAIAGIPGQVLSPKTAANYVTHQHQNSVGANRGGGDGRTDRSGSGQGQGRGRGRGRRPDSDSGSRINSTKQGNQKENQRRAGGGKASTRPQNGKSRARTTTRGNGTTRSSSGRAIGSAGRKRSNSAKAASDENVTEEIRAEWEALRKEAGLFELIYPFSAETLAVAKTTASIHGQPVKLDAAFKKSVAHVRAYQKGTTTRAKQAFERLQAKPDAL